MAQTPTIFVYMPAANATYGCPSGNSYTSNSVNLVYNIVTEDVNSLVSLFGGIELNSRNNVSIAAPTSADDFTKLYGVGSLWVDVGLSSPTLYVLGSMTTTAGSAVWITLISPPGPLAIVVGSWTQLSTITGSYAAQGAEVYNDTGTHTDPVTSATVPNAGIYSWSTSPAGWQWISADGLLLKAPINSPTFTGIPAAPTAGPGTDTTQIATTAFVLQNTVASQPAEDGFDFIDPYSLSAAVQLTQEGPEIGGLRSVPSTSELILMDRFGFTHGQNGDFTNWEIQAIDAKAVARSATDRAAFVTTIQRPVFGVNHIISDGQSLSLGENQEVSYPNEAISTTALFNNLMFGAAPVAATEVATTYSPVTSSNLYPMVTVPTLGEQPVVGSINMMKFMWLQYQNLVSDVSRGFVVTATGVGGRTVAQLSPGASPNLYGKNPSAMSQVASIASGLNKTAGCPIIQWLQGEQDYSSGTTASTYSSLLIALMTQMQADILSNYTNQQYPAGIFTYQTSGYWVRTDVLADNIAQAQLTLSMTQPNWFMAAPSYPYPNFSQSDPHLTTNGYRWLGTKFGQAMFEVLIKGRTWKPLIPLSIIGMGQTVLVSFSVPYPPIQFQPVIQSLSYIMFPNKGFEVYDNQGSLVIMGVKILGSATVGILCNRPLGNGARVRYAGMGAYNGYGNLCDSDPTISLQDYVYNSSIMGPGENIINPQGQALAGNPYPLQNWCTLFDEPVSPYTT